MAKRKVYGTGTRVREPLLPYGRENLVIRVLVGTETY